MRYLPLRVEMAIHGKQDRAGRLLTEGDRMAAYPEADYWLNRYEMAAGALLDIIGREAFDAWVDQEPDTQTWLTFAYHAEARLAEARRAQAQRGQ